ncbi:MAG: SpoIIE family protein phosphatase [Clostridia bacterium]|nr:SpoIIE family protein phosphatase [Clostridia bacterium]
MANSYNESAKDVLETKDLEEENKDLFLDDLSNNFEDLEDNIFYDDLIENENISEDIYDDLIKNNEMTEENLINILSNNDNCKIAVDTDEAKQNITAIVKVINATYRIHKLNILWKVKEANNKRVLATQLGGVSKVISSIAEDIDEKNVDSKEEKKEEKYKLSKVVLTKTKNKSEISGDNNLITKLEDGKYMFAISDGMGSGLQANKSSNTVISMLKKMLTNGFDKEVSIGLINSAININSNEETYATIDLSIVDLNNGNVEFVKNGACPTFIKSKNKVEVVKAVSFPAGVLDKIDLVVYDKDLKAEDIIIMCSDGILESNTEYENKEVWLKNLLENIETNDIEKIANIIMQEAIDNGLGIAKDDMTVIVSKLEQK